MLCSGNVAVALLMWKYFVLRTCIHAYG